MFALAGIAAASRLRISLLCFAICVAVCAFLTPLPCSDSYAATLIVDVSGGADYTSIQEAVDAAASGDEVLVMPGRYRETISIIGKDIHLVSSGGPVGTIIDGSGSGPVIHCIRLSTNSSIQGFTITNGVAPNVGGGIYLTSFASPLVKDNIIVGNRAEIRGAAPSAGRPTGRVSDYRENGKEPPAGNVPLYCEPLPGSGGGIYVHLECLPTIVDNVIKGNEAVRDGGGVVFWDHANAVFEDNLVFHNKAGRHGGGVFVGCNAAPRMERNVLAWNEARAGGGLLAREAEDTKAHAVVTRNTFYRNSASGGAGGIQLEGPCSPEITRNLIGESGGAGIRCDGICTPHVACNNVWGSDGEDFDGDCFDLGLTYRDLDNDTVDTEFCAPWASDFRPCSQPLARTCGSIGAEDDTCAPGSCGVSRTSWGLIKALYAIQ